MKKNSIMVGVMFVIAVTNLAAQDGIQVNAATSRAFDASFQGAQQLRWTALSYGISQVKFHYQGNECIAYFDKDGALIQSGRRVKHVNHLPLNVQAGLQEYCAMMEKKHGTFRTGLIYETVRNNYTEYFVWMESAKTMLFVSVSPTGQVTVKTKKKNPIQEAPAPPKAVIARKN